MRYVVRSESDVAAVPKDAEAVQLVRPIRLKALGKLLERKMLRELWLSESCRGRLGAKARRLLSKRGIEVKAAQSRGRAIGLEMGKVLKVIEMRQDERSYREIESATGIPKSTAHYLIKYADRAKVRNGKLTVCLG